MTPNREQLSSKSASQSGWECERCGGSHPTFADLLVCIEQDRLTPERARLVAERIENRLEQEGS